MRIAVLNSNFVKIGATSKKGTEIFAYILMKQLSKKKNLKITAFASGDSRLPVKIESVNYYSSTEDKYIGPQHHEKFANALVSKAISMQNQFDLFHVNMGNGEIILPYARFIKIPVLVTMHGTLDEPYVKKYYSLFSNQTNIHFVSISNAQRKPYPQLNYIKTIYHGVDVKKGFNFNPVGDNYLIWTGRAVPEKGLDVALQVIKRTQKKAKIFPIIKKEYIEWLHEIIIKRRNIINQIVSIYTDFDIHRSDLNIQYQTSKLFLFPILWEEPFGLTLIEAMATGTPAVAFARGSVPEIIKDGETGFLVNPSSDDIRGNWVIKKTGIEGLCEAVERIYSMPEDQYRSMRKACRNHVEKNFCVERMVDDYVEVYKQLVYKPKFV